MQGFDAHRLPHTLGLGVSPLKRSHMVAFLALALGVPLAIVGILGYAIAREESEATTPGGVLRATLRVLAETGRDNPFELWAIVVLVPLAILALLAHRLAWIRITPSGLQGYVPRGLGPGLVGLTTGSWSVAWEQIRAVRLSTRGKARGSVKQLGWARLALETDRGTVHLSPFVWFRRGGPDHRLGLREVSALGRTDIAEAVERTPLLQALRARGFEPDTTESVPPLSPVGTGFDLAKHPGMLLQLALFFTAIGYGVADGLFIGLFEPLEPLPQWPFLAVAVPAALLVVVLGRGAPRLERLVVGGFVVAAAIGATYPAQLRINALTAEPRVVDYVATAPGRFRAPVDALPDLDLRDKDLDAYWAQQEAGSTHPFTLLRGAGGFHQLDLAPLYERTRAFYRQRRASD